MKHALLAGPWSLWNNLESSGPADFQTEFHKDGKCKVNPPSSVLNTWEVMSPTRVKIAWDKTRYWIFDIDSTRTKGRINPGAGTLKDNKSMKATGAGNN